MEWRLLTYFSIDRPKETEDWGKSSYERGMLGGERGGRGDSGTPKGLTNTAFKR